MSIYDKFKYFKVNCSSFLNVARLAELQLNSRSEYTVSIREFTCGPQERIAFLPCILDAVVLTNNDSAQCWIPLWGITRGYYYTFLGFMLLFGSDGNMRSMMNEVRNRLFGSGVSPSVMR